MYVSRLLFVLFLLAVALSVLRFTNSDYSFGIFKRFLACSPRVKLKTIRLVLVCVVSPLNKLFPYRQLSCHFLHFNIFAKYQDDCFLNVLLDEITPAVVEI
jgi:hypothetical protein